MAHNLTLYHYWRSSSSWRVRWSLCHKSIPFHSKTVNLLKSEQMDAGFKKISPAGVVPAMVIDGQVVTESMAMLEWLEEAYSNAPLLPVSPLDRARVRQLCMLIGSGIQPIQNLKVQRYISNDPKVRLQFARYWIEDGLGAYERLVQLESGGTFSFGGTVTLADLFLVPQCYNAQRFGVDLGQFPMIDRINQQCLKLPACELAAPHNQPDAVK